MAWLDNRAWSHPKTAALTDKAFRVWISGICYSSGYGTKGILNKGVQQVIGSSAKVRRDLENAGLWLDEGPDVLINDWDEHNGYRDQRNEERKKDARERARQSRKGIKESDWANARKRLYARDNGVCVDCDSKTERWHADHVPDRETLRLRGIDLCDIDHIQTRCPSCHSRRTMLSLKSARPISDGASDGTANVAPLTVEGVTGEEVSTKEADLIELHQRMGAIGKAI